MDDRKARNEVYSYVVSNMSSPSIYTVYDPEKLEFESDDRTYLASEADIDILFFNKTYIPSDMFILRAMSCLGVCAPEHIAAFTAYLRKDDILRASREHRPTLVIPEIKSMAQMWDKLKFFCETGVVERYNFKPKMVREGREGKVESIFQVSSHGVRLARKILNRNDFPFSPFDNIFSPQDAFASCLCAEALCPFLYSDNLRKVKFKYAEKIGKVTHRSSVLMTFNREGNDVETPKSEDTDVFIEGITFQTNQHVVTLKTREELVKKRVEECASILQNHRQLKKDTWYIFCCEDGEGALKLADMLKEVAPSQLDRCLVTSGNVLTSARALVNPKALRNCFLTWEITDDGKYQIGGAVNPYFLKVDAQGFGMIKI